MNETRPARPSCAVGCAGVVIGMLAGAASWRLADAARRYCGAYVEHSPSLFSTKALELPIAIGAGGLVAVAAYGLAHSFMRRRDVSATSYHVVVIAVVLTALVCMAWLHFAWLGTAPGGTVEGGQCTHDNVPIWWPHWLPA